MATGTMSFDQPQPEVKLFIYLRCLSPVSPTLSWVAFGVILIGGLSLVTESARGLFRKDIRLVLPRVLLMLFVGGVCGYLVARG